MAGRGGHSNGYTVGQGECGLVERSLRPVRGQSMGGDPCFAAGGFRAGRAAIFCCLEALGCCSMSVVHLVGVSLFAMYLLLCEDIYT